MVALPSSNVRLAAASCSATAAFSASVAASASWAVRMPK
ncbi:Uncharacterised protein [Bordetella pertussis]|nr:Uncharacterised protein [Bordetella pertussis]